MSATTKLVYSSILALCIMGAAFLTSFVLVYFILGHAPQENARRVNATVKAVCDYSREIMSGEAEHACGIAQDRSTTEYLCPSKVTPTRECWVEDKR